MPEVTQCQVCSSTEPIFIQSSYVYLNSAELNLVKCAKCGLVYLNPQPAGVEIENLYSKEYFIKWYGTEKKRGFSKNFFRRLMKLSGLNPKPGQKLLDVGCGMGFFLEVAREWGWEGKGVEIAPYAVNYCGERLNFNVHCGSLETASYPNDDFNIVTAFDFLEHISGLSSFLSEVKRILKKEGQFIVLVPNYDSLVFQLDRNICRLKKLPLTNVPEHLTYFTLSSLKQLLEENGFKLKKLLTTDANDEGEYLLLRGAPKAVLRALLNNVCYLVGKMSNRQEAILAIAKKG